MTIDQIREEIEGMGYHLVLISSDYGCGNVWWDWRLFYRDAEIRLRTDFARKTSAETAALAALGWCRKKG